uniref:exodeoxyribonuclease III n=1 Tax=Leptobrachium leishanense TaxID=445787 RepID=A0A8C5M9C8_9ANUR
ARGSPEMPVLFPHSKSHTMKIFSLNVKGLNIPHKRHSLYTDISSEKPDVICLQETHFKHSAYPRLYLPQYTTQFHATSPTKTRGVSILIQNRLFETHRLLKDPGGRYIILVCTINSRTYTLVSVYAPNASQTQFISRLLNKVQDVLTGTLIICGDFNLSIDPLMDRSVGGSRPHRAASIGRLRELMTQYDLYDTWRLLHPTARDYSFRSRVHNSYTRIDYFFAPGNVLPFITDCCILPITWSDHAPVLLTAVQWSTFR